MGDRYVVTPVVSEWGYKEPLGTRMEEGLAFRSDTNDLWMSVDEIKAHIAKF
jgi:UDP-N-acetylglucosamine 4,6-dehydratase